MRMDGCWRDLKRARTPGYSGGPTVARTQASNATKVDLFLRLPDFCIFRRSYY
jgi:hypothetical protein